MEKKESCEQNNSSSRSNAASSSSSWTLRNGENNNNEPSEEDSSMDDYCVYTYKGDSRRSERLADLPSSFFEFCSASSAPDGLSPPSLENTPGGDSSGGILGNSPCVSSSSGRAISNGSTLNHYVNGGGSSRRGNSNELYSPDMDFLEMDFDPGGAGESCDNLDELQDDSDPELFSECQPREEILRMLASQNIRSPSSSNFSSGSSNAVASTAAVSDITSLNSCEQKSTPTKDDKPCCRKSVKISQNHLDGGSGPSFPSPSLLSIRLVKSNTLPDMGSRIKSFGESPVTTRSAMVVSNSAPLIRQTSSESSTKKSIELEVNGAMIWTWEEAREKNVRQIGSSACGATAVLNVMAALEMPNIPPAIVNSYVGTRLRENDADLDRYLLSRSNAGATHVDLVSGIDRASNGQVYGRFFQASHDLSSSTLIKWLLHWICQGAVPVFTLNLQIQPSGTEEIPDAWHHQMVFGVTQEGVCLNNPVELKPYSVLIPQLTSPSVLLVRRQDVILRKGPRTDLRKLVRNSDPRWNEMNVLGQVSSIFLEEMPIFNGSSVAKRIRSTHISIPAEYKAGISLFVQRNTPLCQLLQKAEEL